VKTPEKQCIGLELAYNRSSLTIAEDRGQPDISGATFGVTLGPLFALPRAIRLTRKITAKAIFHRFHLAFQDPNSISRAELELAGFSGWLD